MFGDRLNTYGSSMIMRMAVLLLGLFMLGGCGVTEVSQEKLRDLDYTVLSEDKLPVELKEIIDTKKQEPFKMTFEDGGYLYICQGYGEQPTGGYSIQVRESYVTSNAIYFAVSLIGPSEGEAQAQDKSYPYIVVKTEYQNLTVVFE